MENDMAIEKYKLDRQTLLTTIQNSYILLLSCCAIRTSQRLQVVYSFNQRIETFQL